MPPLWIYLLERAEPTAQSPKKIDGLFAVSQPVHKVHAATA